MPSFLSLPLSLHLPVRLLALFVRIQTCASNLVSADGHRARSGRARLHGQRGQATTEYALVLLAAALVGLLVVAWATAGGGAERVGRLFNRVLDSAIERV